MPPFLPRTEVGTNTAAPVGPHHLRHGARQTNETATPPRIGFALPTPVSPHGDSPRTGYLLHSGLSARSRQLPVHRLYWTGSSGPPGPAPNGAGSRLTAAFRLRSVFGSTAFAHPAANSTLSLRPMETRCRAPLAPDSLDDGNRRSETVISTPAFAALSSNWRRKFQNPNTPMARRRSPASACATGRGGRLATRARCLRRQPITCRRLWLPRIFRATTFPNGRKPRRASAYAGGQFPSSWRYPTGTVRQDRGRASADRREGRRAESDPGVGPGG